MKRARHGGEAEVTALEDESSERLGAPIADRPAHDSPLLPAEHAARRRWPAVVMIASMLGAAAYVLPRSHFAPAETRTTSTADVPRVHAGGGAAAIRLLANARAAQNDAARIGATVESAPGERAIAEAAQSRNDVPRRATGERMRSTRRREVDPLTRPASAESSAIIASGSGENTAPGAPGVIAEVTRTRWQSMADAMAACQGGFFDRLLCRQKARIAFCDGYWGRVAECATAPATDVTR